MQATTLTVPAEYREEFLLAAIYEVKNSGEWVAESADSMPRYLDSDHESPDADLQGSYRHLGWDMEVLTAALHAPAGAALEITNEVCTLAHVAESMADKIIPPKLSEATEVAPFNGEQVERIARLTDAMAWAAGKAAEFHVLSNADAERKAVAV